MLNIWTKASLPVLSKQRKEEKLKNLIDRYNALKKKEMKHGGNKVDEEWLHRLFDIFKCSIPKKPLINKRLVCSCEVAN